MTSGVIESRIIFVNIKIKVREIYSKLELIHNRYKNTILHENMIP